MEIGNCKLTIASGSGVVQLLNITPAEAILLKSMHASLAVPSPVSEVCVTRNETRSYAEERKRLRAKYSAQRDGKNIVDVVFPGETGVMPEKFDESQPKPEAAKPVQKPVVPAATKV